MFRRKSKGNNEKAINKMAEHHRHSDAPFIMVSDSMINYNYTHTYRRKWH